MRRYIVADSRLLKASCLAYVVLEEIESWRARMTHVLQFSSSRLNIYLQPLLQRPNYRLPILGEAYTQQQKLYDTFVAA